MSLDGKQEQRIDELLVELSDVPYDQIEWDKVNRLNKLKGKIRREESIAWLMLPKTIMKISVIMAILIWAYLYLGWLELLGLVGMFIWVKVIIALNKDESTSGSTSIRPTQTSGPGMGLVKVLMGGFLVWFLFFTLAGSFITVGAGMLLKKEWKFQEVSKVQEVVPNLSKLPISVLSLSRQNAIAEYPEYTPIQVEGKIYGKVGKYLVPQEELKLSGVSLRWDVI